MSLAIALGTGLAACLCGPTQADVIDDFEDGFRLFCGVATADTEFRIVNGELNIEAPAGAGGGAGAFRVYEIPEVEPITFSVDLISMGSAWSAGLILYFGDTAKYYSWTGSYALWRLGDHNLVLTKGKDIIWLFRVYVGPQSGPETLSLTLRRQGDSLALTGTLARRDSGQVIRTQTYLDTPAVDPTFEQTDTGAPFMEPTSVVMLGGGDPSDGTAVLVFDNWRCSHDPASLALTARRTDADIVTVEWEGDALLIQADLPSGGWAPCPAEITASPTGYSAQFPLTETHRFFRLGPGAHLERDFESGSAWSVGKTVPGAPGGDLTFALDGGKGRAYGHHLGDRDFVTRSGLTGLWWSDCVVSVDLVDWEPTMAEGSAFGIVLRANPQDHTWFVDVDGLPQNHYLGRLTFKKPGSPAESLLSITGPGREVLQETSLPAVDRSKDYRLRFWAVADQLTLELFDLEDPETVIATCSATDGRSPRGIEALYVNPTPVGRTQILVDNFFIRGLHAPAQWEVEAPQVVR